MLSPQAVTVGLAERSYDILVGPGLLATAGKHIAAVQQGRALTAVVTDETVAARHLPTFAAALDKAGVKHVTQIVAPGESSKSFPVLAELCSTLLAAGVERQSTIIALGGGVVGDLAGFASAILLRGTQYVQVPTTLLAQVDSSVGGKTGIDMPEGKNLVGAFHQPRLVLADTNVLDTLPRRELLAGYAEVVKYGLIGDAAFFTWLEEHGPAVIEGGPARIEAVVRSCRHKAAVVAADERESGQRALLNLGHTFGHALEAETGYTGELLHGEAVAIGMALAFDLSARLGLCPLADAARVHNHLAAIGLPTGPDHVPGRLWNVDRLLGHMAKDKKVRDGMLTLVLVRGIGQAFVTQEISADEVRQSLQEAIAA